MMAWSHETSAEKGMKIVISSAKLRRVHGFWWLNVIHEILYGGYPPAIKRGSNITHLVRYDFPKRNLHVLESLYGI